MARIDWVRDKLDNWARWQSQRGAYGQGYPKQSAFVRLAPSGSAWGNVIPVDDVDASRTNEAVEALRNGSPRLYEAVHCMYVSGLGIKGTAQRMGIAVSSVHSNLGYADAEIARWFEARAAKVAEAGARKNSFTS